MLSTTPMPQAIAPAPAIPAAIADLRFEHRRQNLGLGLARPRISWIVETAIPNWRQAAYEIEAYDADGRRHTTGRVESDQSVLTPWPFAPLVSRQQLELRVRAWESSGLATPWSERSRIEAGLLAADDWSARFITPDWDEDTSRAQPGPLLRREFDLKPGLTQARLYITALGVFEAQINGATVGDQVMDPGWTSYHRHLRYQTFDAGALLRPGPNAIGVMLGDGWHRGRLSFGGGRRNNYGDRLALLAQLEICYADGAVLRIVSDESWKAAPGPILASDIYDGEIYDARREQPGWSAAAFDDAAWAGMRLLERDLAGLAAPGGPPIRRIEVLPPVAISASPSGRTIVDFGQNLVGRLRLRVSGPAGRTITLRHAEILENGELCRRLLRTAQASDQYTLRGDGEESWEPRFTFHGFRYAEVEGWPGELAATDIEAVVCHSDLERTGWFECSEPLLNRLHENVVWSMRGNFLDVPTDCPQRDERLGWTGDIQLFAPTACFLYDCAAFLGSWLTDLAADQGSDGAAPFVVPDVLAAPPIPAAGWGDAAVIVPWVLYQRYGDAGILATQFESMRAWVDLLAQLAGEEKLWQRGFQFGDWLDPNAPADNPAAARTDPYLIATAYFARSAELLGQSAKVLGRSEAASRYLALAAEVRTAFRREFVTPAGRLLSDTATAYALALAFELLPDEEQRRRAGDRLAALVRENGYRISTGFLGTPLVCDALCSAGHYDAAFRLLNQRSCPSWLYPVTMGATTIWERWDSLRPDGSIHPGQMTSFNHYAFGAVADWLHRTIGGLAPAEPGHRPGHRPGYRPGYRRLDIRPLPGGGLTHARARHRTPYGMAACGWKLADGRIEIEVVVPANASAVVTLPGNDAPPVELGSGTHRWAYPYRPPEPRPELSLDSTLAQIYADRAAWETVMFWLLARAPEIAARIANGPGSAGEMTLRQIAGSSPRAEQVRASLASALIALRI